MKYETLMLKLNSGECVCFQNENWNYRIIGGAGKDSDGNYRDSGARSTLEQTKKLIGCFNGYPQEELKEGLKEWTYIDSWAHAYGDVVPDGTKVLIKDNAKEECKKYGLDWNEYKQKMVGGTVEINDMYGSDYRICDRDKFNYQYFPRTAFVITPDEEKISAHNGMIITEDMVGKQIVVK